MDLIDAQTPVVQAEPRRPTPTEKQIQAREAWWKQTSDIPDHDALVEVCKRIEDELMPGWSDPADPWKGRKPRQSRKREDDRRVNTPLAYLNIQQIVATVVPETHVATWRPDKTANPESIGADPDLMRYGRSIAAITKKHMEEVEYQQRIEDWVQQACIYPNAILKLYYERETINQPINSGASVDQDGQDQQARIKQILEDLAANRIQRDDPQVTELEQLLAGLNESAEIEIREGLVLQSVPLRDFRLPPGLASFADVYLAPWMSQDTKMRKREIRQRYPFQPGVEGKAFSGVHPEDLLGATPATDGKEDRLSRRKSRRTSERTADEDTELTVREVWDRESGYVHVLIEGVNYIVSAWKPTKTPAQWYPFHLLVINHLPHQVEGVSSVELQQDEQSRINRKRSDEEKARWHSLEKYIVDSTFFPPEMRDKLIGLKPFKVKALPLGGKAISDSLQVLASRYDPAAFDTTQDRQDLQRAANISAQSLGVTGEADFAAEVEAASTGTAISAQAVKNRVKRALARLWEAAAQILQQEVSTEAALEMDPTVLWPTVYGDKEAQEKYQNIQREARAQVLPSVVQSMMASGIMPAPAEISRQATEQAQPVIDARCVAEFGLAKPLSRQSLYRRLRLKIRIALDADVDRNQRLRAMMKVFESAASLSQAAMAAGQRMDLRPFLVQVAHLFEADEDLVEDMFTPDPNNMAGLLAQALADGEAIDPAMAQGLMQALAMSAAPTQAPMRDAPPVA